jgi:glutaredoxin/glutathione-dependent peroxiredoxin
MAIQVGDRLPAGVLWEFIEEETPGCSVGPNSFEVEKLVVGKKIAIFGLPGAFTPTCSAKHVPGYVKLADELRAKGSRRDLVPVGQRRLRHGRVGPRAGRDGQGADAG